MNLRYYWPAYGPVFLLAGVCRRMPFVVVCNTAGGWSGGPAAGRVGGRAADTPRRASSVTSR